MNRFAFQPILLVVLSTAIELCQGQTAVLKSDHMGDIRTKTFASPYTGMDFALIPSGQFIKGSPREEACRLENEVQVKVLVDNDFYIGKCEVTQSEYESVTGLNPSLHKSKDNPVENVSWYDAVCFCNSLSKLDNLEPAYQISELVYRDKSIISAKVVVNSAAVGYRLPTEVEWEYACRAGTETPFCFGKRITAEQVNYNGNYPYDSDIKEVYRETTVAAESLITNRFGLYCVHGNVREWCVDVYGMNVETSAKHEYRTIRGGGWSDFAENCRSAYRLYNFPHYRHETLGFRVALNAGPSR